MTGRTPLARSERVSRVRGARPRGRVAPTALWRVPMGGKGVPRCGVHHGGRRTSFTVGERERRAVLVAWSEAMVT